MWRCGPILADQQQKDELKQPTGKREQLTSVISFAKKEKQKNKQKKPGGYFLSVHFNVIKTF